MADDEKNHREFLILIKVLLKCMAIVEIDREVNIFHKYWFSVLFFLLFSSVGASAISVLLTAESTFQVFLAAETAGAMFSVISILFVCQLKRQNLIDIYNMIRKGIKKETIPHRLTSKNIDLYTKFISWNHQFSGFLALFAGSSIFLTLLQATVYKDYDNADGNTLLYPSRYPWSFNTVWRYSMTYVWQLVTTLPIFSIIWANVTFTMVIVLVFQSYTNELVLRVDRQICLNDNEAQVLFNDDEYYEHLKGCIQLHQQLKRYFIKFRSWFILLFNTEIAYVTVEISILSYSGLKGALSYGNSVKLLFFMTVLLVQLYFHCNVGETFYEMNDPLTKTLFNVVFDIESSKTQKLVIMFIQQTQMPYALTGFKTFRVSLSTMTKTIRLSYNFFNLFLATDGKIVRR